MAVVVVLWPGAPAILVNGQLEQSLDDVRIMLDAFLACVWLCNVDQEGNLHRIFEIVGLQVGVHSTWDGVGQHVSFNPVGGVHFTYLSLRGVLGCPMQIHCENLDRGAGPKPPPVLAGMMVRVKELAGSPGADSYEAALRVLFGLDPDTVQSFGRPDEDMLTWPVQEGES